MKNIKVLMNKLFKTGFFSIYLSTICAKFVTLLGGIFIVRILSQNDYGTYTLVINAIAMLSILGDFGSSNAILHFAIENENDIGKKNKYIQYSIYVLFFSGIFSAFLITVSFIFYPYLNSLIRNTSGLMLFVPLLTSIANYIGIIFRIDKKNNKFSLYQFISTIIHYIIVLAITYKFGLIGCLVSQYVYNIINIILGLCMIGKRKQEKCETKLRKEEKREFLKMAIGTQITNTINGLLYTIDIFMLGLMITSAGDISVYKVSTVIPNALVILPQCLSIYFLPIFIKHKDDGKWLIKNSKKVIVYGFPFYLLVTVFLLGTSKLIINLLYGEIYSNAVLPYNILVIGFLFVASIKQPISSVLYVIHKVRFNTYIGLFSLILNIIFNVLFIKLYGMIGVAVSTLLVNISSSIVSIIYLKKNLKKLEE